jgi:phosphoglycerate dehydrogenase-like enzyme
VVVDHEAELRARIGEIEVLFAAVTPRGIWDGARRLRLIQLMGAGADRLLPAPELPPGVRIAGARGVFAAEVAEHALALTLALARGLSTLVRRQEQRVWQPFASRTLAGQTMGVLGMGNVGRRVARGAEALGMRVLGLGRRARDPGVWGPDRLDELLAQANVLVVTLPLTPDTSRLLDHRRLRLLPPGAVLVNVGRGGVVDEDALDDALREGHLGGAGLDVFEEEPLGPRSALWTTPNVLITPHLAGLGVRYVERIIPILLDNVRRLEAGEALTHEVDRDAGY